MSSLKIRLTKDEIQLINLFETVTNTSVKDCIVDNDFNRVIFVVKEGEAGLAIGKGGKNINLLKGLLKRSVEVVEHADTIEGLVRNSFAPIQVKQIRVSDTPGGPEDTRGRPDQDKDKRRKRLVVVEVDPKDKALAIGKNGRTIEKVRLLARRYFQVDNVHIV